LKRKYTDEDIIKYSKEVISMGSLLKKLNMSKCGGNYITIKNIIKRLGIDTSHWLGQSWSKNKQFKPLSEYIRKDSIRKHLIKLRGHKCEMCGNVEWLGKPIMLETHHIDGNKTNNDINNLQLLCPNCHSTTNNWRKKK